MGFFGSKKEREAAKRLGLTVAEVERELPEFTDDGGIKLEMDKCMRYSLPRRFKGGATWSLLQRTKEMGAALPNQYLLESSEPLPEALMKRLHEIAEEYDAEYFEFEGTANEVAVYWLEWGGADKVRGLHAHLERIAAF